MAKSAGLAQAFYIHGYDISGDVGALTNVGSPRNTLESTGIDKSAVERLMGHGDGVMEWNVWFNDAAGQAHTALSPLPTTDVIALWQFGATVGNVAAGLVAKQMNYDWTRGQDGSLQGTVQAMASNGSPLEWLEMLTGGKITHASASSTSSRDDSASSSNGIRGYLEVVDIDSGTPTVVIEESSDDGAGDAFTTILAFDAVADGAEPTAQRKTATGTVEQYLRVTSSGTFTNLDFVVAYVRGTAQDDESLA